MVDAREMINPPFTLYMLNTGDIAIRREGSIMKM